MKKFGLFFCALLIALTVNAVPAKRDIQSITQTDGTTLNIIVHGDEFFHYTTTEDGYLITSNTDGIYEYANVDTNKKIASLGVKAHSVAARSLQERSLVSSMQKGIDHEYISLRRQVAKVKRDVAQRSTKQITGTAYTKVLILLVGYKDVTISTANATAIKNMFEQSNYNGCGSVKEYFTKQSNSIYTPSFDVYGPFRLSNNYATYGANDDYGDDVGAAQMVTEAAALANSTVDFSQYDNDNDGYVDVIYTIYAGKGEASGGDENTIWPHRWDLYWAGIDASARTFDGVQLYDYACSSELNGSGTVDGMGTFCHEFSHILGLPDYYDTDYEKGTDNTSSTLGMWNLMDYGSYNNNGKTPPNYSAYDKYFLGWATPQIMNKAENVTIPADGQTYRAVTSGTLGPKSTSIVYYFENRQKTGFDAYLPGHGLLVTKVKYNSTAWSENTVNNGTTMYFDIQEADNESEGVGDASDTYPGTQNKTSYTPISGYPLTNIKEASSVISFQFMGGIATTYTVTFNANEHGTCATTSLTETTGGAGVTLPSATAASDYAFVGWATTSNATVANAGQAGATYYPTSNCTLYAVYNSTATISLAYDLDGVTKLTGPEAGNIAKGTAFQATFSAAECYEILSDDNAAVEVKVNSVEITNCYTYNAGTLTISLSAAQITGNISITIYNTEKKSVTFDFDNATTTGKECASAGATYTATITPNTHYLLTQDDFLITMGGVDLTAGTDFTYIGTTLTVPNVTGDLVIVAIATEDPTPVDCTNYSYTFEAKTAAGSITLGDYNWTCTIETAQYFGYDNTKGAQIGSSSYPAKQASWVTNNTSLCCVDKVSVSASMGSSGDTQLAVYVNNTQIGTTQELTTTNTTYDFTLPTPTKGAVEIRMTNTKKALYIKQIDITYGTCSPITNLENNAHQEVTALAEEGAIRLQNIPQNAQIRVFDIMGRLMANSNITTSEYTYKLSSGIYTIQVIADGQTHMLKAICK